jgi:hypothetical protein
MPGMNGNNVIIPGRGAVFTAPVGTAPPDYLTMTPDAPGGQWLCLGHTSKENPVTISKDGGDVTKFGSWWEDGIAVTREATDWTVTANALELRPAVFDLAFSGRLDDGEDGDNAYIVPAAGGEKELALFILALQGTKRMGVYFGKTSVSLGDAPSFDPTKLFEVPLLASILSVQGDLMRWYAPGFEAAAAAVATP